MEATYVGIHMWKQAVEKAGSTDVDKVRDDGIGQILKAFCCFVLEMDANHHLHKPVMIGEVRPDGQFSVVWKTKEPIRAQPWSPFIPGNENKPDKVAAGKEFPTLLDLGRLAASAPYRRLPILTLLLDPHLF